MRPETRTSMEMLFSAKWNLPKAAKHANLTNKEMKITFNEYCNFHPPTYVVESNNNSISFEFLRRYGGIGRHTRLMKIEPHLGNFMSVIPQIR